MMSWISRARQNLALTIGGGGGGGLGVGVALYIVVAAIFGGDAVGMCDHPLGIDGVQLKVRCPAEATPTPTLSPSPPMPTATAIPTPTPVPDVVVKSPQEGADVFSGSDSLVGDVYDVGDKLLYIGFSKAENGDNLIYPQGPVLTTQEGGIRWAIQIGSPGDKRVRYDLYILKVSRDTHEQWQRDENLQEDPTSGQKFIRAFRFPPDAGIEIFTVITIYVTAD